MGLCRLMAEWHWLLWSVPFVTGLVLAGIGSRVGHKALTVLALVGTGLPLVQASLMAIFFLWGPSGGFDGQVQISWMTERLFQMTFSVDSLGVWAVLVLALVSLAAQVYGLAAVARMAGRHRFYALLQMTLASGALFFTSRSPAITLVGWEGMAVSIAFMAGFWESEQKGERTGMRWLLFQRTSGLLLLLGLLALEVDLDLGLTLLISAAVVRAGQFPFHGWLPDSAAAPAAAGSLIYGAGSTLAAVFLLVRFEDLIIQGSFASDLLGVLGMAGIGLGVLAGLQQYEPGKSLGWLYVTVGGYALLGFAVNDSVAALLFATSQALVLGGMSLAVGTLIGPVAEIRSVRGGPGLWQARRAYLVLSVAMFLPPSLGFVGLGRLMAAAQDGPWLFPVALAAGLGTLASGFIGMRIYLQLTHLASRAGSDESRASIWMVLAPAGLASLALALGVVAPILHGWEVAGGAVGLLWAAAMAGGAALGGLLGWLASRGRTSWLSGRLTRTQRVMERVAGTGLGIGEALVQLPILVARALGVIVWRVIGGFVIDTLVLGTAYKTVEGVGFALRMVQNGRVQRYTLVAAIAALVLVISMLR